MPRHGTECSGLGHKVGTGHSLASMGWEGFPSLNDAVIIRLGRLQLACPEES